MSTPRTTMTEQEFQEHLATAAPEDKPEILRLLTAVEDEVQSLVENVAHLINRLRPVSAPDTEGATPNDTYSASTEFGMRLSETLQRVYSLNQDVNDTHNRLEI